MNDRGEKIISLAREMLRSDMQFDLPPPPAKPTITFKILCLATMLTAAGSYGVAEWSAEARRPITRYEKTELNALVFYAARLKGITEDSLRREVENHLNIVTFDDLTTSEFQIARRYLQEKSQ